MSNPMLCWTCTNAELKNWDANVWVCRECNHFYFMCKKCEENGEITFDSAENVKGLNCISCKNYYCNLCWQNTGTLTKEETYLCDKCLRENCLSEKNFSVY